MTMLNTVTPSWRWIMLIAVGVLCTTINTVDVHDPAKCREGLYYQKRSPNH
jgi:hypothetical protein